jgi:ribosomal protein S8
LSGFTESNDIIRYSYTEIDSNYDFITNKYKLEGIDGYEMYTFPLNGKYLDTIQFIFYTKVLNGGYENKFNAALSLGGKLHARSIDLNYNEGYQMISIEVVADETFTYVTVAFYLKNVEAIVGSLSVIKNTGVKTYTYTDSNLKNYDSKDLKRDMSYDNNLVESSIGTNLPSTNYRYDGRNNIIKEEKPYLLDINNTYTPSNQLLTKELLGNNSNKIKEECIYDTNHFLHEKKDSLLKETTYTYDSLLNILSITKTNKTITYGYNTKNMISSVSISNGNTYSFIYDIKDNLDSISINNETIGSYSYDSYGRIASSSYGFSFIYDVDKLTSIKYNNSTIYSIEYDTKDRIEEIKDLYNNTLEEYIYDDEDKLEEKNIRDLNARYDYSDSLVGDILYTLRNHKEYHSYNSIQKSFNTSKEAILHQFEKEGYVGEYRENYKLKYKNDLKLPNYTFTFERFEDNYIP